MLWSRFDGRRLTVRQVSVDHAADWWLGELEHPWFLALESAISDEWGVQPMRVREGGVRSCVT